ncbi:DNA repair protein RecO, partial [Pseudoxanthomonas sp. SGD-10]
MLHKTRGIVLRVTDYAENSVVAKIYTEKFGVQSYLINGIKKPKARIKLNMLQALHLLDMVVYHKPNGGLQKISDARSYPILTSIPYDIVKSSVAIFLNEMIYKSLREQTDDPILFEFIYSSVELLDHADRGVANFHLLFLSKLTRFLGFFPDMSYADSSDFFDLKSGAFTRYQPPHNFFIETNYLQAFIEILRTPLQEFAHLKIGGETRKYLLDSFID